MFQHILVPLDFGPAADRALELALALATKFDSELELVHAFYIPPIAYADGAYLPIDEFLHGAHRAFDEAVARARETFPRAQATWLDGDPRLEIVRAATTKTVDLIVMGTHGHRGLSRVVFGSVAERIVRTSPVPVLTTQVRAEEQEPSAGPPVTHVLVPTDFGEVAAHALDVATKLAAKFDAKLTLLHVHPVPAMAYQEAQWPTSDLVRDARRTLDATLAATKQQWARSEAVLLGGDARKCILEVAAECAANLVVMGTHGRRGLPRLLVGSVAEGVVRASPVPVLTVSAERP